MYNEKYLKAKIKSNEGKHQYKFYGDKMPKLPIILIDSVF